MIWIITSDVPGGIMVDTCPNYYWYKLYFYRCWASASKGLPEADTVILFKSDSSWLPSDKILDPIRLVTIKK